MVNAENLSRMWMIGKSAAERTLHSTMQHGIRRLTTPAARRFRTQMKHLRYPTLPGIWYGDTMQLNVKSIDGHRYAHVLGNGKGYIRMFPMETKNETHYSLDDFIKRVGSPEYLLTDNDPTMKGWKEWKKRIREHRITPLYTEPYSCLLYTSSSPRDGATSRMPSSA